MKVVAVTVNYRTAELAVHAVASVINDIDKLDGRIVVVDNDSGDGSFDLITSEVVSRGWSELVDVLEAPRNGGFGYGNNIGIRTILNKGARPEYFYLFNPDTCLEQGELIRLVEFLEANSPIGIVGNRLRDSANKLTVSAFRFPNILSEIELGLRLGIVSRTLTRWTVRQPIPEKATPVDWVSGASLLIRRSVLEQIGLFDESFFLYFEETDLCRRAKSLGWSVYYFPGSTTTHIGQMSTGSDSIDRRRPVYWYESRRHYYLKHYGALYLWIANVLFVLSRLLWRIRRIIQAKPEADPPGFLRDFVRYSFWPLRGFSRPVVSHGDRLDPHESKFR